MERCLTGDLLTHQLIFDLRQTLYNRIVQTFNFTKPGSKRHMALSICGPAGWVIFIGVPVLSLDKIVSCFPLYHMIKTAFFVEPAVGLDIFIRGIFIYELFVSFLDELNMIPHYIGIEQVFFDTIIGPHSHRWY
jgi:hypothetical protein